MVVEAKINVTNFKPVEAPRRKPGLLDNQISVGKYRLTLPVNIATKLGQTVALLKQNRSLYDAAQLKGRERVVLAVLARSSERLAIETRWPLPLRTSTLSLKGTCL